ncbi:MAG: helix-turn-helix domain-containing protein [Alistipes sp.]|nr:helix-turn-helix domain-containing protein [Alistipes sp.]
METILKELQEIKRYTLLQAKQVLDMDDAVLLTGLSKSRLYTLTSQNKIPFHKSPEGRNIYFSREELNDWMLSRSFESGISIEKKAMEYCRNKKII